MLEKGFKNTKKFLRVPRGGKKWKMGGWGHKMYLRTNIHPFTLQKVYIHYNGTMTKASTIITLGKGAVMRCIIGTSRLLKGRWSSEIPAAMYRGLKKLGQ